MILEEDLIQLYVEQYIHDSKRKSGANRASGYEKRINAMMRTLKRAGVRQVSKSILEDYHRQIKNLLTTAVRYKNKAARDNIINVLIPELVRLDLELLLPEEKSALDDGFMDYILKVMPGAVCTKSLFEMCQKYRRYCIENRITELVPSKPEMGVSKSVGNEPTFYITYRTYK